METFIDLGILSESAGSISFTGDDFDKIYWKYYARNYRIAPPTREVPYDIWLFSRLTTFLQMRANGISPLGPVTVGLSAHRDVQGVMQQLLSTADEDLNPFGQSPDLAEPLYWCCIDLQDADLLHLAVIRINAPQNTYEVWYRWVADDEAAAISPEAFGTIVDEVASRASVIGGGVSLEVHSFPVAPRTQLIEKLQRADNQYLKERIAGEHDVRAGVTYVTNGDIAGALLDAEMAVTYQSSQRHLNNLGYLKIAKGDLRSARLHLEQAVAEDGDAQSVCPSLARYNLGIVDAMEQRTTDAVTNFDAALELVQSLERIERQCLCLFILYRDDSPLGVALTEVKDYDLLDATHAAIEAMRSV